MKKFICSLRGHNWDTDWRSIDLSVSIFKRVDCLRCGLAIDGVALKRMSEIAPTLTRGL